MPAFTWIALLLIVLGGLVTLFILLAVKTKFTATRVLAFTCVGALVTGVLGVVFCMMVGRIPSAVPMLFVFLAVLGLMAGTAGYFLRGLGFYKENPTDTAALIRAARNIWWPLVVWQLIMAIIALVLTATDAMEEGGSYGSGPIMGIPGIVLGLVFFSQYIKRKAWAGIALGILGGLGILLGLISLVQAAAAELEGAGVFFVTLGSLFSMGWGVLLLIIGFFSKRIKDYVKGGQPKPAPTA
jgi:hypothetical protein